MSKLPINIEIEIKSLDLKYKITKIPADNDYQNLNGLYFHHRNNTFTRFLQFEDHKNKIELSCDDKEIKLSHYPGMRIIFAPIVYLEKIEKNGNDAFSKELKMKKDCFTLEKDGDQINITLEKGHITIENEDSKIIFSIINNVAEYE